MNHFRLRFGPFQLPKARIGVLRNIRITVRFESPSTKRALLEQFDRLFAPGCEGERVVMEAVPRPHRIARWTITTVLSAVRSGLVRVRRKVVTP